MIKEKDFAVFVHNQFDRLLARHHHGMTSTSVVLFLRGHQSYPKKKWELHFFEQLDLGINYWIEIGLHKLAPKINKIKSLINIKGQNFPFFDL